MVNLCSDVELQIEDVLWEIYWMTAMICQLGKPMEKAAFWMTVVSVVKVFNMFELQKPETLEIKSISVDK